MALKFSSTGQVGKPLRSSTPYAQTPQNIAARFQRPTGTASRPSTSRAGLISRALNSLVGKLPPRGSR